MTYVGANKRSPYEVVRDTGLLSRLYFSVHTLQRIEESLSSLSVRVLFAYIEGNPTVTRP
jgi:hypothetical protein